MGSITFRLKSSRHIGAIDVPGAVISCREVQEAVASRLSAEPEEIRIFMSGSSALIHPAEDIPTYAVLDVVRQANTTKRRAPFKPNASTFHQPTTGVSVGPSSGKAEEDTEEERLKKLQASVAMDTGMSEVGGRFRGRGGYGRGRGGGDGMGRGGGNDLDLKPPPDSYVCHNCGKGGHFIQHCPNRDGKNLRVLALPTGIPEALLVECSMDDPAPKFITKNHKIVKRKVDSSALENMIHFQEKGKLADQEDAVDGPNRFKCIVDGVIAVDALKTPCCKKLVCDACFQKMCEDALESDDPMSCPSCGEGLMMDDVLPAEDERKEILELKSKKRPREGDTEE